jgi:hypothetical protein
MRRTSWVVAALAAGFVGLASGGASAAPLGSNHASVKSAGQEVSGAEQVAYRCWWHRGHRHCRWVEPSYRHYYYYAPRPYYSFYFGPRYRRWY